MAHQPQWATVPTLVIKDSPKHAMTHGITFQYGIPCPGEGTEHSCLNLTIYNIWDWKNNHHQWASRGRAQISAGTQPSFQQLCNYCLIGLQPPPLTSLSQYFSTFCLYCNFLLNCNSNLKSLTSYLHGVNFSCYFTFKQAQSPTP